MVFGDDAEILVRIEADVKDLKSGLDEANKHLKDFSSKAEKETSKSSSVMIKNFQNFGKAIGIVFGVASAALVAFTKSAVEEMIKFERSMTGLEQVAQKIGADMDVVNASVKSLSQDGFLGAAESAQGLRNLLASGLSLDQATALMLGFKDAAVFGRKEGQSMGEFVAKSVKMLVNELGNAEDKTKVLDETMRKNAIFSGDAAAFTNTFEGSILSLNNQLEELKIAFATALRPELEELMKTFMANKDELLRFGVAVAEVTAKVLDFGMNALAELNRQMDKWAIKLAASVQWLKAVRDLLTFKLGLPEFIEENKRLADITQNWETYREKVVNADDAMQDVNASMTPLTKSFSSLSDAAFFSSTAMDQTGQQMDTVKGKAESAASGVASLAAALMDVASRGVLVGGGLDIGRAGNLAAGLSSAASRANLTQAQGLSQAIAQEFGLGSASLETAALVASAGIGPGMGELFRRIQTSQQRVASFEGVRSARMGQGLIRTRAHGGLVTSPEIALIGEAGPEKVVPLNRPSDRSGLGNTVNIYIGQLSGVGLSVDELIDQFQLRLRSMVSY